ncbi:hypothetical protein V8F20_012216 [Naviculisporaceae sp. PSN 640]
MVKIAIAGASGNVGLEVVDALASTGKHEVLALSRTEGPPSGIPVQDGVRWVKAEYTDLEHLTGLLKGVDTVLSFIVVHNDPGNLAQKNLIDASIKAGVRRFAPSEWAGARLEHMPRVLHGKLEIREYLKKLNTKNKVLEYSLFQPGLFVNYLTHPHGSAKYLAPIATPFDFNNRRALILDGSDNVPITLTTVQDLAKVVTKAVEHTEEWPVVSGISGETVTVAELIAIGERVRGGAFNVERLKYEDLKEQVVKSSWRPKIEHAAFTPEEVVALESNVVSGIVIGIGTGMMEASDEWNKLLPDYKFTKAEEFLASVWEGKN